MTCKEQSLRELLPSYLEGALESGAAARVELHVARCPDCADELALLRLLADEPVPDPGEAFWASLPDRVHREVRQQGRERSRSRPTWPLSDFLLSPWTRGAAVAAAIVLVSWLVLRPATPELPATGVPAETVVAEDIFDAPGSVTEMELSDESRLASWMGQESVPLLNAVERVAAAGNGLDRSLEEYLSALDRDELKGLAAALTKKQEAGT